MAEGSTCKRVHLLGERMLVFHHVCLSTKWFSLPHSMVAGFQEGVSQETGSGSCQFLKAWAWEFAQCDFCHILLVKAVPEPTTIDSTFKRKGHRLPPVDERSVKEFVAILSSPQELTEREKIYALSKIYKELIDGTYKELLQIKKRTAIPIKKMNKDYT